MQRTSSPNITELKSNEVFVFGSNKKGFHLGGAARIAYAKFGAEYGNPVGIQGQSYAIPTLDEDFSKLTLAEIEKHVNVFIMFAGVYQQFEFLVTEIGCGIAGFNVSDIAPMFKNCVRMKNVYLPKSFFEHI